MKWIIGVVIAVLLSISVIGIVDNQHDNVLVAEAGKGGPKKTPREKAHGRNKTPTPTATETPAPTPTATIVPITPTPTPSSSELLFWKNAKSDFDDYHDSQYHDFINGKYSGMLTYEPYFNHDLGWYDGLALFNQDLYAVYTNIPKNDPGVNLDWILQDASGNDCYIPYGDPYTQYAGDVGSQAFRDWWIGYVTSVLDSQPYDGVYVDDVNLSLKRVACGSGSSPSRCENGNNHCPIDPRTGELMTNDNWKRYMVEMLEQLREAVPNKLIAHNSIWYIVDFDDPYLARQIQSADIIQMEQGFIDDGLKGGAGTYSWIRKMDFVTLVHGYGVSLIDRDEENISTQDKVYGFANFLLMNDGSDYYDPEFHAWPDDWWDGYDIDLGAPLGGLYHWNDLLYRRDFENGTVLVNPPGDVGKVTVDVNGVSVTLDDREGIIQR